jgi:hypothetical protein
MADFCNVCSERLFGQEIMPDIDVESILKQIKPGYEMSTLCEGCGMVAVGKNKAGDTFL